MTNTKSIVSIIFLILVFPPFALLRFGANAQNTDFKYQNTVKGTAIVITGAAARIPQEAALLEQLYITGQLNDVTFITGASSGALNTVVLNALLSDKINWEDYKAILFGITNDQVFARNGSDLPLDTRPLQELIRKIVNERLGYYKVKDLPFASSISATNAEINPYDGRTYRFSNRKINKESNPDLDLIDILMASAAIPVVFPSVKLNLPNVGHPITFIDGGVSQDHIPFEAAREYEKLTGIQFEKMIIVSRKNMPEAGIGPELENIGIKDSKLREKLGASLQHFSKEGFIKKLIFLQVSDPDLAARTFVYVPDFEQDFPMLDFNNFRVQYEVSATWAGKNKPIPLDEYISGNVSFK